MPRSTASDPLAPPALSLGDALPAPLRGWWQGLPQATLTDTPLYRLAQTLPLLAQDRVLVVGDAPTGALEILGAWGRTDRPAVALAADPSAPPPGRAPGRPPGRPAGELAGRVVPGDPEALPFADRTFTVVVVAHQARRWDDTTLAAFLREAWRVLTHNGVIVLWEIARSRSAAVNAIWRTLLGAGAPVHLRSFAEVGHATRDAGFAWIQTVRLQPYLWPPGPRVTMLARKEYYDEETIDLPPGVIPDAAPGDSTGPPDE